MKIGIRIGNWSPEEGGSFTFQDEILKAFIQYSSQSKHQFVIISRQKEFPGHINTSPNLEYASLYWNSKYHWRIFGKSRFWLEKLISKLDKSYKISNRNPYLDEIVKDYKIDLIYFPSPNYSPSQEVPYITTVWDLQHRLQPFFPEVSADGIWESQEHRYRELLPRAACILVGTEIGKAEVDKFFQVSPERIKILPFPTPKFVNVPDVSLDALVLEKYRIPPKFLFYPAQFWPHKNHVNLLLALQHLKNQFGLDLPLVFTGSDKGNRVHVEKTAQDLDLLRQVYFLGFVSQNELVALYRQAFALTYVTFFGPDNLPPLEAFALGCPVIASKVSGAEEQLGDAALLVNPQHPEQIATGIKQLWDSPALREQLIDRGYERAQQWSVEDYVKALFTIFDEFEAIRRSWGR